MNLPRLFASLPERYRPKDSHTDGSYYFSIGSHKYTVVLAGERCEVQEGKTVEQADVVLKTTPELFEKVVVGGKMPGMLDVARGRIKTNNVAALTRLRTCFDFSNAD
jgi:long-chain acyl-CoA synthetase